MLHTHSHTPNHPPPHPHTLPSLVLLLLDISKCILVSCVFLLPCLAFVFLTFDCSLVCDHLLLALPFACYLDYSFVLPWDIVVCWCLMLPVSSTLFSKACNSVVTPSVSDFFSFFNFSTEHFVFL